MVPNSRAVRDYEDGVVALGQNEVFVDGGAFNGESSMGFIERVKSQSLSYSHVYAFEPDAVVCRQAAERLAQCQNLTLVPKGLWSVETELGLFESSATASSSFVDIPVGSPTANVSVTSLDAAFAGLPDSDLPTFIKMDIEGAEREALMGAAGIIKRKKPKLAICAYHKPEDVFSLPQVILSMRDDYRFALRQHENGLWDTVLYGV
jgi:FkbM family methyltransferase